MATSSGNVLVHLQLVPNRFFARRRDHHGLRLAIQSPAHVGAEMLDDNLHLLRDVVGV